MVYLFLCQACELGNHENCSKGFPAPKGIYGGSKCNCFVCSNPPPLGKLSGDSSEFEKSLNSPSARINGIYINKKNE